MTPVQDCRCCLSRRDCLKFLSASVVSAGVLAPAARVLGGTDAAPSTTDFVDPAGLRPCPEVRMVAAFLEQPRPYWLGWPGTTYDLDQHQQEYGQRLRQSAEQLSMKLDMEAKPIDNEQRLTEWIQRVKADAPHGVLVMLQHMNCWGWIPRISQECQVPLIVFSPVGTSFTGHIVSTKGLSRVHVVSTLEWSGVENALRMVKAKRMFEATRVLWIQGNEKNETVMERLGIKVRAIPRDTFNEQFNKQPATEEVKDTAADMRQKAQKIVEPTDEDIVNAGRVYVTAKRLLAAEQANALSMDCLGMVASRLVPTPPCGAWTWLQDQGITCGCEADLDGAVSMMMTSYLLDRPGYMNDPVAETYKNLLIASHCTSGTRLDGFDKPAAPYILRDHSESSLGVSTQVLWPVGQEVTLVRFNGPHQMIIDTGRVVSNVDTPPAGGCRTSIEIAMDNVEDCRDVQGFHQVVTLGNHRRILEGFCELYGIRHVHSPQQSTFATGDTA